MAYRISDLTVATTVAGADQFEFAKASASGSRNITAAALRTQLFSGGAAYSHDPLNVGGALLFDSDNAYDLGASGLNRPRTGYFGTSVVTTTLTGTLSTASQPNITTIGTLVGGAVPASLVTTGTFAGGAYTFPSDVNMGPYEMMVNGLIEYNTNGVQDLPFNYTGYQNGVTQYRNFKIYDGKHGLLFSLIGSTQLATFAGAATVSGLLTASAGIAKVGINKAPTATSVLSITGLPTSSAGLVAGDVWSNAGVLTIV